VALSLAILMLAALSLAIPSDAAGAHAHSPPRGSINNFFIAIITVAPTGTYRQGTPTVHAEGYDITQGIIRKFPIIYRDREGKKVPCAVGCRRGSTRRKTRTSRASELSIRQDLITGARNTQIAPGDHTYVIVYKTDRRIGFFKAITTTSLGRHRRRNGGLSISHAEAIVHLPPGAQITRYTASTVVKDKHSGNGV